MVFKRNNKKDDETWGTPTNTSWSSNFNNGFDNGNDNDVKKSTKIILLSISVIVIVLVIYFSITGMTKNSKLRVQEEKQEQILELAKQELENDQNTDLSKYRRELDKDYEKQLNEYIAKTKEQETTSNQLYQDIIDRYNNTTDNKVEEFESYPTNVYLGKEPIPLVALPNSNILFAYKENDIKAIIIPINEKEENKTDFNKSITILFGENSNDWENRYNKKTLGEYDVYTMDGVEYIDITK